MIYETRIYTLPTPPEAYSKSGKDHGMLPDSIVSPGLVDRPGSTISVVCYIKQVLKHDRAGCRLSPASVSITT